MTSTQRRDGSARRISLIVVAGFTALAALGGAIGLATGTLEMGEAVTDRLPFDSVVFGGLALFIVVAVPMGAVAWLALRRSLLTATVAIVAGTLLVGWILVQIAVIQTFIFLQPVCLALGIVVALLGLIERRATNRTAP